VKDAPANTLAGPSLGVMTPRVAPPDGATVISGCYNCRHRSKPGPVIVKDHCGITKRATIAAQMPHTTDRMIVKGTVAIANLVMNRIIDQRVIRMSLITTYCVIRISSPGKMHLLEVFRDLVFVQRSRA